MAEQVRTPQCTWAETKEFIFLTVQVMSATDLKVDLKDDYLDFMCKSDGATFAFRLDFPHSINVEESKYSVQRNVQFKLVKKESERWRTLSKEKKLHFLKCDWDKWIDSDDEDCKPMDTGDFDMNSMDFGGLGGMGGLGGFDGLGGMDDDSDEDDLPDLDDSMSRDDLDEEDAGAEHEDDEATKPHGIQAEPVAAEPAQA